MHFRIPPELTSNQSVLCNTTNLYNWDQWMTITCQVELRWSAFCALIHEDVLELFFAHDRAGHDKKVM